MRNLKTMILFLMLLLACNAMLKGQANSYDLMPQPAEISAGEGRLVIDGGFRVAFAAYHDPQLKEEAVRLLRHEPRLQLAAARLVARLSKQTGIPMATGWLEPDPAKATLVIQVERAGEAVQSVREDESYTLDVTPQQARLKAITPLGALHGIET